MIGQVIKVFGERNTGTRAVAQMLGGLPGVKMRLRKDVSLRRAPDPETEAAIRARFRGPWRRHFLQALRDDAEKAERADDQWKHAVPRLTPLAIEAGVCTIFMVRNPYSWFLSLARRPYHIAGPVADSLAEFLDRPWMTERRENAPAVLRSPLHLWNLKLQGYETYARSAMITANPCEFIKFEDFVQAPELRLKLALSRMNFSAADISAPTENTKTGGLTPWELRRYYAEEMWRKDLTEPLVAHMNSFIDWQLAAEFGYEKLDPAAFRSAPVAAVPLHGETCAASAA